MASSPVSLGPSVVTTNVDLVVFLMVGFLAGAHCLGMCGPLVGLYADRISPKDRRGTSPLTLFEVRQHALFNGGRVVGYAAAGVLFGALGSLLFVTAERVLSIGGAVRTVSGLLIGGLVVLAGIGYVVRGSRGELDLTIPALSALSSRVTGLLTSRVDGLATSSGIVGLGLIHATLPCPIIYPAYLYAFAIGDPLRGGLALGVLGIGTFPSLFVYGTMLGSLTARQRGALHRVLGVGFVAMGYILLSHGLASMGVHVPHVDLPYYQPITGS